MPTSSSCGSAPHGGGAPPSAPGVAGACGVIVVADLGMLGDLGVHGDGWRSVASAAGAGLVAAVAGWLAVQPRTFDWRPADYLPVVGALAVIVALTWGPLAAYLV